MTATPASSARDDTVTLAAIGVVAACLAATAHEAVGHGGACLAVGGGVALLSNVFFHCQGGAPIVDLAGPLGNLGMALVALAGLLVWRGAGQASKLFLTALLAFSAFWGAGYLLLCGLTGQGDFAFWARDALATPAAVWRPIMIAAGLGLYTGAVFVVARLAPRGPAKRLRTIWLTGALIAIVAVLAFKGAGRAEAFKEAAQEIALASLPLWFIAGGVARRTALASPPLRRSWPWIWLATATFALFVATLGHGLP